VEGAQEDWVAFLVVSAEDPEGSVASLAALVD